MSTSWRSVIVAVAVFLGAFVGLPAGQGDPTVVAATQPSRYVPVDPCRILDTRTDGGRLGSGATVDAVIAGRCGVDHTAVAAAVTITAVGSSDTGYLTAFPRGQQRPAAATLNYRRGDTIANLQLTQLGIDGAISVYSRVATHVVIDVNGYFEPAPGGVATAGRFVPVMPHRLLDTRQSSRPPRSTSVRIRPDVPSGAVAAAITITTTATRTRGYFVAHAAETGRPLASNLNVDAPGQTRTGSTIVALGSAGFDLYTHGGDHLIVDITGYFTGADADSTSDGLFVGSVPTRVVDTRSAVGPAGGPRLWDQGTREFDLSGLTGGPVAAVAANVVAVGTEDRGHAIAFAAGTARPLVSTVNYDRAGSTVASSSMIAISNRGMAVYARDATELVIDVSGWFLGTPSRATLGRPRNDPPPDRRVTIISDSAAAGMRWNGALGGLRGFVAITDLESCRRLVQPSCNGREGYSPRTVVSEIHALPHPTSEEILVIATGYNDWHGQFSRDFDIVIATARQRGFHHIAWVDYRTQVGYRLPGTSLRSNYAAMNDILAAKIDSGRYPEVRLWSLDEYTSSAPGWFYPDGVHETRLGSWGVADWLSRHIRAFDDRPCAMPWFPGGQIDVPCPDPDAMRNVRGLPDIRGLYGI